MSDTVAGVNVQSKLRVRDASETGYRAEEIVSPGRLAVEIQGQQTRSLALIAAGRVLRRRMPEISPEPSRRAVLGCRFERQRQWLRPVAALAVLADAGDRESQNECEQGQSRDRRSHNLILSPFTSLSSHGAQAISH